MSQDSAAEKAKWDDFYRELAPVPADPETEQLNQRFVSIIDGLLPDGGEVLEAGSGAGYQSLALARTGRYRAALLDFSTEALAHARRLFSGAGAEGAFHEGDLAETGEPEYDLVFNSGVLEHYPLAEQARLLRGMASRSRRYVLVLVPNRRCYWYWLWRARMASTGQWPWGRETPLGSLEEAFSAAGIRMLSQCTLGEASTEYFIKTLAGVGSPLAEEILAVHRSPVVPEEEKGYLLAALGCVGEAPAAPLGAPWKSARNDGTTETDELRSALMDSLALRLAAEKQLAAAAEEREKARAAVESGEVRIEAERERRRALEAQIDADRLRLEDRLTQFTERVGAVSGVESRMAALEASAAAWREISESRLRDTEDRLVESETRGAQLAERLRTAEADLADAQASAAEAETRARSSEAERDQAVKSESELTVLLERREAEIAHAVNTRDEALRASAEWGRQSDRHKAKLHEAHTQIEELQAKLAEAAAAHDALYSASEALRKQTLGAISSYVHEFDGRLAEYRSQRAWRVMLAIREAYTKWVRGEDGGKAAALSLPFSWFSAAHNLDRYELAFPDLWRYAPDTLRQPAGERLKTAAAPVRQRLYDIVILSIVDFEFRFQRPQQIAVRMAERGHRVYWLSPTRLPGSGLYEATPLRENLWELRVPGMPVDLYGGVLTEELVDRMMTGLDAFFREQHVSESCAYLQFPFWRKLALRMRERMGSSILYDMMDDWAHWSTPPLIGDPVIEDERHLFEETDVFVVTSRAFAERHKANRPPPLLIANGADYHFFHEGKSAGWLAEKPRPVIGYFGAISTWFDVDLMTEVVKLRPQYSFVFIGQVHAVDPAEMRGSANCEFLGERNYRELPAYLAEFDVALIPFCMNKVVEGVDPVKMYEYFSQGKPVVATRMRELEHLNDILYMAATPEEFAAAIDRALDEAPELRERRLDYARKNTWDERTGRILDAIDAATPKVSILVVTYNSLEFLNPFLDSIQRNTSYANYEVICVDNKSTDGSAALLEKRAKGDRRVRVFALDENLGFAGGNNFAARQATGDWLIFLNPDTIVTPGWIGRLMAPFRDRGGANPVGMTAPVTNFSGNETKINYSYQDLAGMEAFSLDLTVSRRGETMELDCVPLLCGLISRELWNKVGELDERYSIGMFEDDDFCVRIRRAGYRIVTAEDCFLHHFGNGSFKKLDPQEALRIFNENRERFESKWGTKWQPHKLRPGARPVQEETPMLVTSFVAGGALRPDATPWAPILKKIHPGRIVAGEPFHVQPNGHYAIAAECERATPYTFIEWNGELLATAYAGPQLLTALLRPELTARPGTIDVRVVSDLGASAPLAVAIE
ncbi:MAG: glycosyltransferase [Bryobacteraceae bacterium]